MAEFLHGVETISIEAGPRKIEEVKTAIVGLVGTAPIHHAASPPDAGALVRVLTDRDFTQFGPVLDDYTIPSALRAVVEEGGATMLVVNLFDPATHKTTVAEASTPIVAGAITLVPDLVSVTVKVDDAGVAGDACVEDVDYTVDRVTGVLTVVTGGQLDGATVAWVGYDVADPSAVDATAIVGGVDAGGAHTGMQVFLDAVATFGFGPKILIAPGYASELSVQVATNTLAGTLRAIALTDVPLGSALADVLESRSAEADINLSLAGERLIYCYPHLKVPDADTGGTKLEPYSQRFAGVIAGTDREVGYWRSPSNRPFQGVVGLEVPLRASLSDTQADTNQLNAQGITTAFASYGKGIRTWGNHSSAFPGSTEISTFVACRRVIDVVEESIELASLEYLDGPIDDIFIEAVLTDVNAFLRTLISRRALIKGSRIEYFAADNTSEELAAGHVTFVRTFCPPPPAEKITYKSVVDVTLLAGLGG